MQYKKSSKSQIKTKTLKGTLLKKNNQQNLRNFSNLYFYVIIVFFSVILYGNTFKHDYAVDDKRLIIENKLVHGAELIELVSHGTFYGFNSDNQGAYRPLSMVYYSILYQLGNGKPFIYHLFNVLFYCLCIILLFEIFRLLFSSFNPWLSLLGICLFLVHPIHTEVVANVKNADEILCLLFALLSILWWIRYLKGNNKTNLLLSVLAYAFALLCKETAIAYIPVYAVLLFVFTVDKVSRSIIPFLSFVLVFTGYILLRIVVLDHSAPHSYLAINNSLYAITNTSHLWATRFYILGVYAFKMIWALPLSWDYSYGAISERTFTDIDVWLSLLFILFNLYVVVKFFKKEPILVLGIVWFWALLMPASNTFILIESTFAERFLFSASAGFIIIMIWLLTKLPSLGKKIFISIMLIISMIFSFQTYKRNAVWRNDISIVKADVKHSNAIRIQMSFVSDMFNKAEQITDPAAKKRILDSALIYAKKAYNVLPSYAEVNYLLARTYLYMNQRNEAEKYYLSTIKLDSTHSKSLNDLGVIYGRLKNYESSLNYFVKALSYDSTNYKLAENAGIEAFYLKKYELAKYYFDKAMLMNPGSNVVQKMLPMVTEILKNQ
jgi:protein O-mannosyl-transferase